MTVPSRLSRRGLVSRGVGSSWHRSRRHSPPRSHAAPAAPGTAVGFSGRVQETHSRWRAVGWTLAPQMSLAGCLVIGRDLGHREECAFWREVPFSGQSLPLRAGCRFVVVLDSTHCSSTDRQFLERKRPKAWQEYRGFGSEDCAVLMKAGGQESARYLHPPRQPLAPGTRLEPGL